MINKSRSFSCCLNECCIILKSLLGIFQPENLRQQLTQLQLLKELSYLYLEATDWPKSIEYAQNVLNLSEKMNLQNFKADANYILAISYARQNMFEKALLHLHAYEQYCHGTADELSKANLSFAQFIITRLLHGDEASLQHANDFLEKAKKNKDEILELKALFHLSDTHLRLFNVQQGIQFSDKVLQLAKKNCHVKMEIISKIQKALAYLALGEYQNSYDIFMECLVYIQTDYNDKNLESSVLNNICYTALNLTQNCDGNKALTLKKNALICIRRCLVIAKSIGSPERVAIAHLNLGLVHMECYEDYDNAIEHFHKGLNIGEELKSARLIHQGCCCMGRFHEAKGEIQIAKDYYTKALQTEDPTGVRQKIYDLALTTNWHYSTSEKESGKKRRDGLKE